jgi:hypothetical protein
MYPCLDTAVIFILETFFVEINSYFENCDPSIKIRLIEFALSKREEPAVPLLYAVYVTTNRSSYIKATAVNFGFSYTNHNRKCSDRLEGEAHLSYILKVRSNLVEDIRQVNDVCEWLKCA